MRLVEVIRRSDAARALGGASPDAEVERSVWDRLYGHRAGVTATPIAHGAAPLDGLVGGRYRLVERLGAGGMATVGRSRSRSSAPNCSTATRRRAGCGGEGSSHSRMPFEATYGAPPG